MIGGNGGLGRLDEGGPVGESVAAAAGNRVAEKACLRIENGKSG